MATIVTRAGKGSPLTNTEVDANFTNLNTDKAELSGATFTGEITANGGIALGDDDKATFGAGDDLQIYHDGVTSVIEETGSGDLRLKGTNIDFKSTANETYAYFQADGASILYHNGSTKLATTATGIDVTGTATMDGLTVDGDGLIQANTGAKLEIKSTDNFINNGEVVGSLDFISADYNHTAQPIKGQIRTESVSSTGESAVFISTTETTNLRDRIKIDKGGDISFYEDTGTTAKLFWDASAESLALSGTGGLAVTGDYSSTTAGTSNLRLGVNAGNSIVSGGNYNTVVGDEAGTAITTGSYSTALGYASLASMTTGTENTAVGRLSLNATSTGGFNTATGTNALHSNTTASNNTAVGADALKANTTASNNTGVGYKALYANTTGASNVCIGSGAGDAITTGSNNTIIGDYAGTAALADTIVLAAGTTERMRIDSSGNVLVGKSASSFTTAGVELAQGGTAGKVQIQRSSSPLTLVNLTDEGNILNFYKGTSAVGSIGSALGDSSASTLFIADAGNVGIRFDQASIDDIQPCSSTGSDRDNAINLGAADNRFKDLYLSGASYIPDVRSTGIQYFTHTTDARFRNASGTERMRIDASGIDVTGTATMDSLVVEQNVGSKITLSSTDVAIASSEVIGEIDFYSSDASGIGAASRANISAVAADAAGAGDIYIKTSTGGAVVANRLKVANNGDISFYEDTGTTAKLTWDASAEILTTTGLDVTGVITTDGITSSAPVTIALAGNGTQLTLESTDADAGVGPRFDLHRNSASPAANDNLGQIRFLGDDSAGAPISYAFINSFISNPADGAEAGEIVIETRLGGANRQRFTANATATIINEDGADLDFRVESDSGTHALFVEGSSGNVGIGTSSPSKQLHQIRTGSASDLPTLATETGFITQSTNANASSQNIAIISGNTGEGRLFFGDTDDEDVGNIVYNHTSNYMSFDTSATERMRIDSSGNVQVGFSSYSSLGSVNTGCRLSNNGETNALARGSNGTILSFYSGNGGAGYISVTSNSAAYNTSSDQRLKENIADADDAGSKIDAIQVRKYDWKVDGSHQDYGMVAQELQAVAPEAVSGDADSEDMMGVDYSKLVPMLIKEIQSLRNRVAQLEGE